MKLAIVLTLISVFSLSSSAYANEEDARRIDEYTAFCSEQAELAGIEDKDEKLKYVNDCLESYGIHSGNSQ